MDQLDQTDPVRLIVRIYADRNPELYAWAAGLDDTHGMKNAQACALLEDGLRHRRGQDSPAPANTEVLERLDSLPGELRQIVDAALANITLAVAAEEVQAEDDTGWVLDAGWEG